MTSRRRGSVMALKTSSGLALRVMNLIYIPIKEYVKREQRYLESYGGLRREIGSRGPESRGINFAYKINLTIVNNLWHTLAKGMDGPSTRWRHR